MIVLYIFGGILCLVFLLAFFQSKNGNDYPTWHRELRERYLAYPSTEFKDVNVKFTWSGGYRSWVGEMYVNELGLFFESSDKPATGPDWVMILFNASSAELLQVEKQAEIFEGVSIRKDRLYIDCKFDYVVRIGKKHDERASEFSETILQYYTTSQQE